MYLKTKSFKLNDIEKQYLYWLMRGYNNIEIAEKLDISRLAANGIKGHIAKKIGIKNTRAVNIALAIQRRHYNRLIMSLYNDIRILKIKLIRALGGGIVD